MRGATGPVPIVDTHVHLDEPAFDMDRDVVLETARSAGVLRFINIAYKVERWETSYAIQSKHPDVDVALGLHPMEAATFDAALERRLVQAIEARHPVAIGEIGLDLTRPSPSLTEQTRAFRAQLDIADSLSLPIIIHQRNAADELMAALDIDAHLAPIVLHSFDPTPRLAAWAIERGCYVGIGGLAAKPSSGAIRQLLERVSTSRLLLETDAPYLAPPGVPRRNSPANLPLIAQLLAPIWSMPADQLCRITTVNAASVFGAPVADTVPGWR